MSYEMKTKIKKILKLKINEKPFLKENIKSEYFNELALDEIWINFRQLNKKNIVLKIV